MLNILASGSYYAEVDDHRDGIDLRGEVSRACQQRFRRIDRFTQLCLIGAHRCVGDSRLPPQTGLYLGSRFASISNTISVHTQMIAQGNVPKPAHFINTLSNSAGYYVSKNLQLEGKNLFVSRTDASLEAVFHIANLDLQSQQVEQVLVGIADEAPYPLSDHRRRLGVAMDTPLAEASHWFLIQATATSTTAVDLKQPNLLGRVLEVKTLGDVHELCTWLQSLTPWGGDCAVHYSEAQNSGLDDGPTAIDSRGVAQLQRLLEALPAYSPAAAMRYSPALTAGVLADFLQQPSAASTLISIHRDDDLRFHVMRIRKQPQ